ncbi:MAG: hypothetical protein FJ207_01070 [Gemmatimonadetes bacterium]|nr:hypothetical protein [Gemmatimonadota bacterium]
METQFKTLQVVWGALTGGVVIYAVVAYCMIAFLQVDLGFLPVRVMPFVAGLAAAGTFVGVLVRRRLIDSVGRDLAPEQRLARYSTAVIIGLALIEGCGLAVITLGLMSGAAIWALLGGVFAAGVMALHGPSREEAGLGR